MNKTLHLTAYGWRLYQQLRTWLAARGVFEERSEEEFIEGQIDQQPSRDRWATCLNCAERKKLLGDCGYYCFQCTRGAVK